MAITIQERPYTFTPVGQKMIVRVTSSNVGNTGFKFYFVVTLSTGQELEFYVSPNPNNQGIFDLRPILLPYVSNVDPSAIDNSGIVPSVDLPSHPVWSYVCDVYEAYVVDGVLEYQAGTKQTYTGYTFLASYKVSDGYRPNPTSRYGFSNTGSLMMGDRNQNTYLPALDQVNATNDPNKRVVIPTRDNELDWGVISVISEASGGDSSFARGLYVNYTLTKADNTTENYNVQLSTATRIIHLPAFPANLNEGALGTLIPADFTGWKNYVIQLYNGDPDLAGTPVSAQYVFIPVETDCVYDNVRLAWWSPVKGGFDYFNFSKLNERSVSVERKRIKRIVGNYNTSSTFGFNTYDRGLEETEVMPSTALDITSDWVQEGEFALLENLVRAKYVWIVNDDGSCEAVVVDTNSFTADKKRDGKLKRVNMRIMYSNENFAY